MGCGSGSLACAIAHHLPTVRVWASDLTDGCINVTRRNAKRIDVSERVTVAQGDLFAGLAGLGLEGSIDVVVCNPPYISQSKLATDRAEVLAHEPQHLMVGPMGSVSSSVWSKKRFHFCGREGRYYLKSD
jgi:release factor glutamine methyltransferase